MTITVAPPSSTFSDAWNFWRVAQVATPGRCQFFCTINPTRAATTFLCSFGGRVVVAARSSSCAMLSQRGLWCVSTTIWERGLASLLTFSSRNLLFNVRSFWRTLLHLADLSATCWQRKKSCSSLGCSSCVTYDRAFDILCSLVKHPSTPHTAFFSKYSRKLHLLRGWWTSGRVLSGAEILSTWSLRRIAGVQTYSCMSMGLGSHHCRIAALAHDNYVWTRLSASACNWFVLSDTGVIRVQIRTYIETMQ